MEQKFKIGDKVTLKSGSPVMTITNDKQGINQEFRKVFDGRYACSWFDADNKPQSRTFPEESLDKVE